MTRLARTLSAWDSADFIAVLKQELQQLGGAALPLQQGLTRGSIALEDSVYPIIISVAHDNAVIRVKAGLQYSGMIAGCGCADDPTPDSHTVEYCTVLIEIDRDNADTRITLLEQE